VTGGPTPTTTSSGPSPTAAEAPPTRRHRPLVLIAAAGLTLGLLWLVVAALRFSEGALVDGVWRYVADDAWAFDLEAYVDAARRLLTDGSLYAAAQVEGPFQPGGAGLFYYAPPLGVAMLPLVDVPIGDSAALWYLLRVGALLAACALMPVRPIIRVLAFAAVAFSFPVLKDAVLGNVSILLMLPLAIAWRWLDRPAGSIALAVGMSLRPSLGVFLAWQLLRRQWAVLAWTLGAGLVLIALTLPFVGFDGYRDFLSVLVNLQVPGQGSENRDLGTVLAGLGGGETALTIGRVASLAIGIAAIVLSVRRDREVGFMVTLGASLLLTPMLWDHYLVTLLLPAAFLADRVRPVFVLLPLLAWLPGLVVPFVVLGATLLPFIVPDPRPGGVARSPAGPLLAAPTTASRA
jgi:Glycosyltransferase family 87